MKKIAFLIITILSFGLNSCEKCEKTERGCTDSNALNHNFEAEENDGSCTYSMVTFYAKYGYFGAIPIQKIEVSVDGNDIGSITSTYPNGPGNCSATGTLRFEFQSDRTIDWNSTVYLANGAIVYGSGNTSPNRYQECIKVNITK